MSEAIPSSAIVVAAVLRKSCGVQEPPLRRSVPAALLRLFSASKRVRSFICFDMDLRLACASGLRAGKHQAEEFDVRTAKCLN